MHQQYLLFRLMAAAVSMVGGLKSAAELARRGEKLK
jgi:hypothetical protein